MTNKHTLLNNKLITNSASLMRDIRLKSRALIMTGNLDHNVANGNLIDFFDIVIADNIASRNKLGFADIVFYSDASAYKDGLFVLDDYCDLKDTIIMTNFGATKDLIKLKRDLGLYNLNYIPSACACTSVPGGPLQNELNFTVPAIHLALVLGCTTVYCDTPTAYSTNMDSNQLKEFLTAKKSIRPANMLSVGRMPLIKAAF